MARNTDPQETLDEGLPPERERIAVMILKNSP